MPSDRIGTAEETRTGSEPHSDPVRDFYTRHPYPPPVDNLDRARDEWRDANRHRAEYHLLWPGKPYWATLDILIAGEQIEVGVRSDDAVAEHDVARGEREERDRDGDEEQVSHGSS